MVTPLIDIDCKLQGWQNAAPSVGSPRTWLSFQSWKKRSGALSGSPRPPLTQAATFRDVGCREPRGTGKGSLWTCLRPSLCNGGNTDPPWFSDFPKGRRWTAGRPLADQKTSPPQIRIRLAVRHSEFGNQNLKPTDFHDPEHLVRNIARSQNRAHLTPRDFHSLGPLAQPSSRFETSAQTFHNSQCSLARSNDVDASR